MQKRLLVGAKRIEQGAFSYFNMLEEFILLEGVEEISQSCQNLPILKKLTLPNTLKTLESGAFASSPMLTEITIPDSVESISYAFGGLSDIVKTTVYTSNQVARFYDWAGVKREVSFRTIGDYKKSPYVTYPSTKGNILCRVLYDINSEYGLQIISDDSVTEVTLGVDEYIKGQDGGYEWARTKVTDGIESAISYLNSFAEEYIDKNDGTGLVKEARCVGSNPKDKSINNESDYTIDESQLKNLGIFYLNSNSIYWLASCYTDYHGYGGAGGTCGIVRVSEPDSHTNGKISEYTAGNYVLTEYRGARKTNGFRPVFVLNDNVKFTGGDGTPSNPYTLGF